MQPCHMTTTMAAAALGLLLPAAAANVNIVDVAVDASGGGAPLVHKWKRSFGSGHASLTLRDDWRAQASQAAKELGAPQTG